MAKNKKIMKRKAEMPIIIRKDVQPNAQPHY